MRTLLVTIAAILVLRCGEPAGPTQTTHGLSVIKDETWTLATSPHIVQGRLFVSYGATLTIEAGATVLFDSASGLTFGSVASGTVRALGTPDAPVTLRALDSTATPDHWFGFALRSNTVSELHYVDMSGCGIYYDSLPTGCLVLGSPLHADENPTLLIDHVTVHDARGGAVIVSNDAHFAPGSTTLTVVNMRGYPAQMRAREAARFPLGGGFTANDSNEVRLTQDTLRDSVTLAPGVPWTVMNQIVIEGPNAPVLTIPPGDTILMKGGIVVGYHAPGGLRIGTETGPTAVLRAADTSWGGIELLWNTITSSITNAVLDNCGRVENSWPPNWAGTCISVVGDYNGILPDPAPVLRHVTMNALGVGLGLGTGGRLGAGSADLTVIGVSGPSHIFGFGPPISIGGRSSPSSIPPGSYTGTIRDEIWLTDIQVVRDDTFPNLGLAYVAMFNGISVGDSTNHPTLTLLPGTTITFASGSHLLVGRDAPGAVRAIGTGAQPITLKGQGDRPDAWSGITIGTSADSSTMFEHTLVDQATDPWFIGAFQFYKDIGPVIRHSTISNTAGCAIIIMSQPAWSTDFTDAALGNTFTNNAGGAVCGP
jgi:hypothetical protein